MHRFIPESLRWLITKGKLGRAEALVFKICHWNKILLTKRHEEDFIQESSPITDTADVSKGRESSPSSSGKVAQKDVIREEIRVISEAMKLEEEQRPKISLVGLLRTRRIRRNTLVLFYVWSGELNVLLNASYKLNILSKI
ncbi:unnamed protein product [Cyprideis torosa]|uniref:Uncharacterized protein n=1 Tax=Cyprideis torosa TaxID=163714 RepID=A0A7R8ZX74_9CRUS|nr:unnamed protein product [Cyprideis torosa]CAG0906321.1 unnamed protein product [Cyprideis torosa]